MIKTVIILIFICSFNLPLSADQISEDADHSNTDTTSFMTESTLTSQHSTDSISVYIKNIPEKEGFWSDFFKVLLPTLAGGFILWLFQWYSQDKYNKKQNFEKVYFNLLEEQGKILEQISFEVKTRNNIKTYKGVEFFSYIKQFLKYFYDLQIASSNIEKDRLRQLILNHNTFRIGDINRFVINTPAKKYSKREDFEGVKEILHELSIYAFNALFEKHFDIFAYYYRHLFYILEYIESNEKNIKSFGGNISQYIGLLKVKLSPDELFALFYNGLKFEKMGRYINKYSLVEFLAEEDLLEVSHKPFYNCKIINRTT